MDHVLPAKIHTISTRQLIRIVRILGDAAAFVGGPILASAVLWLVTGSLNNYLPIKHIPVLVSTYTILALGTLAWFWAWRGHYTYRKPMWSNLRDICVAVAVCALAQLVMIALLKWSVSRYMWVLSWLFIFMLLILERTGIRVLLSRLGLWRKQCVIIGDGQNALDAYRALTYDKTMGFDVQYFYSTNGVGTPPIPNLPVLAESDNLWRNTDPNDTQYVIALDYGQEDVRDDWLRETTIRGCRAVSVIPPVRGIPLNSTDMSFIFSHDVMILRIQENLQKRSARILKRAFDIAGSLCLLILLSPVLGVLWWKINREGGAPIYGHERVGYQGKKFPCLKFRSMVPNSKEVLANLLENDPEARAEWEQSFKLKDDPRITPLGHFLRRTSLDELPQLWNVLRGEMSLVGPRPVVEAELQFYGKHVDYYLLAKPGMTGLWQVSGRSDVDYDTRVYFDAWYVRNWSLWHDMVILFKTVGTVLRHDGAY